MPGDYLSVSLLWLCFQKWLACGRGTKYGLGAQVEQELKNREPISGLLYHCHYHFLCVCMSVWCVSVWMPGSMYRSQRTRKPVLGFELRSSDLYTKYLYTQNHLFPANFVTATKSDQYTCLTLPHPGIHRYNILVYFLLRFLLYWDTFTL